MFADKSLFSKVEKSHFQSLQLVHNMYDTMDDEIISINNYASIHHIFPAGNCMFKVNNRNTRTWCEICSKLTIKIPERRHWRRSGIFIVNLEHISHLVLVFLLLTLSR